MGNQRVIVDRIPAWNDEVGSLWRLKDFVAALPRWPTLDMS